MSFLGTSPPPPGQRRMVDVMVGAGDGRIDAVKDAWVTGGVGGAGLRVIKEHKRREDLFTTYSDLSSAGTVISKDHACINACVFSMSAPTHTYAHRFDFKDLNN